MLACAKVVAHRLEGELVQNNPVWLLHWCYIYTFIFGSYFLGRFMALGADELVASQLAQTRLKRRRVCLTPNVRLLRPKLKETFLRFV